METTAITVVMQATTFESRSVVWLKQGESSSYRAKSDKAKGPAQTQA